MANILDRYGIKEVADVVFYDIETEAPVLFLDSLKVSTIEQTAEQTEARGGKGNPPLIVWDYNKEINVTLEDALFSAKSMAIMFGGGFATYSTEANMLRTFTKDYVVSTDTNSCTVKINGQNYTLNSAVYYDVNDTTGVAASTTGSDYDYVTGTLKGTDAHTITISSSTFPGTYKVVGDTYARSEKTGKDEAFQFEIAKAKVQSENTITLEAEGDPSVFNMSLRVLRPADGEMMKLIKYSLPKPVAAPQG